MDEILEPEESEAALAVLRLELSRSEKKVLVLIDDVFSPEKRGIKRFIEAASDVRNLYILATSREDEWNPLTFRGINIGQVGVHLSEDAASRIAVALEERNLRYPDVHWHAAFVNSRSEAGGHLLLEYMHYLRQGQSLEATLREQVSSLSGKFPGQARDLHDLLRTVSTLDFFGCVMPWATMNEILPSVDQSHVSILKDEFLVLETASGNLRGLHRLRSGIIAKIYSESHPIANTVTKLVAFTAVAGLPSLIEGSLSSTLDCGDAVVSSLTQRLVNDVPVSDWARILHSVDSADQAVYARLCAAELESLPGGRPRTSVLQMILASNAPGKAVDLSSITVSDFRQAISALPPRPAQSRIDHLFKELPLEKVEAAVPGMPLEACRDLLEWTSLVNKDLAQRICRKWLTCGLRENEDIEECAAFIRASRDFDVTLACSVADALGGTSALSELWRQVNPAIAGIEVLSDIGYINLEPTAILAGADSWHLGHVLLDLTPSVSSVIVRYAGSTSPVKNVVRDSTISKKALARNVLWETIFLGQYCATSSQELVDKLKVGRDAALRFLRELVKVIKVLFPPHAMTTSKYRQHATRLFELGKEFNRGLNHLPFLPFSKVVGARVKAPETYSEQLQLTLQNLDRSIFSNDTSLLTDSAQNAYLAEQERLKMIEQLAEVSNSNDGDQFATLEEKLLLSGLSALLQTCVTSEFAQVKERAREIVDLASTLTMVLQNQGAAVSGDVLKAINKINNKLASVCLSPTLFEVVDRMISEGDYQRAEAAASLLADESVALVSAMQSQT
ncbi:MAG: hypothetical protein KIS61_16700 [Candidatus Eremiobacteraeota bacterium]|nr:hypothetical protein [Candidatus Eremiobacteraeota bacterium]